MGNIPCFFLSFWLSALSCVALGQHKYEREYRIDRGEVPEAARFFLDSAGFERRVKWYGEENLSGHSVEAKVKRKHHLYSIEFDTLGQLEDIEIKLHWAEVPEKVREKIKEKLHAAFVHHHIRKTQVQYSGSREQMLALVREQDVQEAYTTRYELIVRGKTKTDVKLYEMLFDAQGKLLQQSDIVLRNTDNLEY